MIEPIQRKSGRSTYSVKRMTFMYCVTLVERLFTSHITYHTMTPVILGGAWYGVLSIPPL